MLFCRSHPILSTNKNYVVYKAALRDKSLLISCANHSLLLLELTYFSPFKQFT